MNTPVETMSPQVPQIYLTDNAAQKLHQLFLDEGKPGLKLRIFIEGGGCSGFKYEFAFETATHADDRSFKKVVESVYGDYGRLLLFLIWARNHFLKKPMTLLTYCLLNQNSHYEVEVVIDSMSFLYLQSSEVDYEENFQDSRFIIRNPNAKTSCGCGSSFSV